MTHYEVHGYEEGHPLKGFKQKFNTLAAVQGYVKERWQGPDYIDGPAEFHTDYVAYELHGCVLADLGKRTGDGYDWEWKAL